MRILKILFLAISLSMPLTSYACWDDDEDDWGTWDPWNEDDDDDGSYDYDSWTDAGWDGYGSDGNDGGGSDYDYDDYYGYGVVITPDDNDNDGFGQSDLDDDYSDDYDDDWNDDYYDDDNTSSDNDITVRGQDKNKPSYDLKDTDFLIKKREELEELVKKCYKQINKDWCLSTTIEYTFLYYGLSINEGDIVKYIVDIIGTSYLTDGFFGEVSIIEQIIEGLFFCEKILAVDIVHALSEECPVLTNVQSTDCTHSVIIIGYNDGHFICIDPLTGNFAEYAPEEFKCNYIIKINNIKK